MRNRVRPPVTLEEVSPVGHILSRERFVQSQFRPDCLDLLFGGVVPGQISCGVTRNDVYKKEDECDYGP